MSNKDSILHERRTLAIGIAILVGTALLILISLSLYISGVIHKNPKMEISPKNSFSETITVVTDRDYAPFSWILEDGSYSGLDVELIYETANRLGVNVSLQLLDWTEANRRLKEGEADVILNMEIARVQNDPEMIATIPTCEKEYVAYGREIARSPGDLYGKRIGTMQAFPELGLDSELVFISSYAEMFEQLQAGKLDYVFCPIQVGNDFLTSMNIKDVRPGYAVSHMYGCMALRSDQTDLRDRLNTVLKELSREGFLSELDLKWVDHRYEELTINGIMKTYPWLPILLLLLCAGLACLILMARYQRIAAIRNREYSQRLQEHILVINTQNEQLTEAKQKLEEALVQVRKADAAKTTFLTSISHDVRTPLNGIQGMNRLIRLNPDDREQVLACSRKIDEASNTLLSQLNDLIEMSTLISSEEEIYRKAFDLGEVIQNVMLTARQKLSGRPITAFADLTGLTHHHLIGDSPYLSRILTCLLDNAVKFTLQGSIILRVLETPDTLQSSVFLFEIEDSGIGISEEFLPLAFKPFTQECTGSRSSYSGSGIGLAICDLLISRMDGSISLSSRPGEGTTASVRIPFDLDLSRELPLDKEPAGELIIQDSESLSTPVKDLSGLTVLIAEDNEMNMEILTLLLDDYSINCLQAENGLRALEIFEDSPEGSIDAVLMDLLMPVMGGLESASRIRTLDRPDAKSVPIIAVSANASREDIRSTLMAGMNAHTGKPVDLDALVKLLSTLCPKAKKKRTPSMGR